MADKVTNLYNALVKSGYAMEPEDQFRKNITDPKKRKAAYNALVSSGYSMEPYEEFESNIGHGKPKPQATAKSRTTASTPAASQTQPQSTWHPTEQEKIRMSYELNQMVSDSKKRMQGMVDQTRRMTERFTPEGRKKAKAAKFRAQLAGTPTRVMGITPPTSAPATASKQDETETTTQQQRPQSMQSPIPYGVVTENGKPVTQWLLPDGRLTTSLIEADQAEYGARTARLQHQFVRRMKTNGLDVSNPEDVKTQTAVDAVHSGFDIDPEQRAQIVKVMEENGLDASSQEHIKWFVTGDLRNILEHRRAVAEDRLKELQQRRIDRENEQASKRSWWEEIGHAANAANSRMHPVPSASVSGAAQSPLDKEIEAATAEVVRLNQSLRQYDQNARASRQSWAGKIGLGLWDGLTDINTWTMGVVDASVNHTARNADPNTDAGRNLLQSYISSQQMLEQGATPGSLYSGARFVGEMFGDPVTYISLGAGNVARKTATNMLVNSGKKKVAGEVAQRLAMNSKWTSALGAAAGSGVNFATFEGLGDVKQQWIDGGYTDSQGNFHEGFSISHAAGRAGHGFLLGVPMGLFGAGVGNAGDWAVRQTTNTAAKAGIRASQYGISVVGEGTIFAMPEIYNFQTMEDADFDNVYAKHFGYADETDPNKRAAARDAARNSLSWDAWTESQANIFGMKVAGKITHGKKLIGDVRSTLRDLRRNGARYGLSFRETLNQRLDKSPFDVALTKEEHDELRKAGYGELADIFRQAEKSAVANEADPNSRALDFQRVEAEEIGKRSEFDGYEVMERLMQDGRVSEATRAKAYFVLTGKMLPPSTVVGFTEATTEDGSTIINATNAKGEVVTTRIFKKGQEAKIEAEKDRIKRQAELNSVSVGEQYAVKAINLVVMDEVKDVVAKRHNLPIEAVESIYMKHFKGERLSDAEMEIVNDIDSFAEEVSAKYQSLSPEAMRGKIEKQYGINVDKALSKPERERSENERDAVKEYLSMLYQESERQRKANSIFDEQVDEMRDEYREDRRRAWRMQMEGKLLDYDPELVDEANRIYEESRELWDGIERNDPEAQAEVDAIGLRMQEAWQMCEDAFAEQAEYWMYHVKEDPWSLINDPALTADQQEAVLYYINSKAAMDGVMDAANESADRKRAEVETAVSRRTHHDSKTIIPATMKVDDRPVYIVKGNVVMHPDGSAVDVRNSDESIVVCDAESGEYSFTSPDQIFKVDEPISPEDELNTAYAGIQAEQEAILDTSVDTEDAPVDEAPEEPSVPIADTKEYDKGYEDGIEVSKDLSNEVLDSTIEDLRGREFLSDEWRGRLEAYEYEQQRRAMEGQNVPMNEESGVPKNEESVLNTAENAVSGGDNVPEAVSNEQTALSRIPTNEEGEPMFEGVDRETALDGLVEATGGNVENAHSIALAQVQQLSADLESLKKKPPTKKAPKLKGSPMAMAKAQRDADEAYATAVEEYNNLLASTKQRLDAWTGISSLFTSRKAEARAKREAEMAAQHAKAHDEAVARFEEEQRIKAEKQAEQDAIGTHAVNPKITEKWNASPKVEGNPNAITLPDGSTIRGRYYLTEAGAASASHDANNGFIPTEGFPIDKHGLSVNDRDYQRDNDAQAIVRQIADSYDNRALQSPVIVSKEGVVLSGNNRTMSGDLAAHQGTDKAYVDYLREFGQMYGFTPEQIDGMTHPRVVFVPDEAMPYDASTFSRFNAQEMKSQSKPEAAVKLGKIVPDNVFGSIVRDISRYDRMSDYYADEKAVAHALGSLMQAGVINDKQMPELRTGTALSAAGKELIENTLIGKVFQATPDAVRQIISVPTMRQSIVMGLSEIANNRTLSDADYDLAQELGKAVDLVNRARAAQPDVYTDGMPVSPFGRMQGLFDDEFGDSRVTDATTLLLADILNSGKPSDLRKVLATYNSNAQQSANGQADIFTGTIPTKEEILTTVNDHFRNATPKEQQALVDAAIADRKRRAEERRGGSEAGEQTADALQRGAEPQSVEPTEAQKKAGNYKMEHRRVDGHNISIENPKGSVRRGTDADGKSWETTMQNDYGYIRGTKSVDGDHIDVFLSDTPEEGDVFVIDQVREDGSFDEHKVMYGFPSEDAARKAYLSNYDEGWQGLGAITHVSKEEFKKWIQSSKRKTKPFADYASVRNITYNVDQTPTNVNEEGMIVDGEGKPLTLYHGTPNDVELRDLEMGHAKEGEEVGARFNGDGISFTPNRSVAEDYASDGKSEGKVFEVNITLKNPFFTLGVANFTPEEASEFTASLQAKGHDGIINYASKTMRELGALPNEVIVFDIKSASPTTQPKYDRTVPDTTEAQRSAISRIIDFAKNVKNRVERAVIGGITKRQAKDFAENGIDVDETWVHSFESSAVAHNQKHHGGEKNEAKRGQIAITAEDYARIPEILEDYDKVSKSPNKTKGTENEVIIYEKEFGDGYVYYLEEKRDNRKSLSFHTMYKKKKGTDSSDGFAVDSTAPITPVAPSDNLSSNSDGKDNTLSSDKQENSVESSEPYTITPAVYVGKSRGGKPGKETPMHRVRFNKPLTAEQERAVKSFANEVIGEKKGRFATKRGWADREAADGSWLFRSEEDARKAAELISDTEAVADRQPLTAQELREAVEPVKKPAKPKKAPINRVSVEDMMTDLSSKGEAKLSDHAEPVKTEPEAEHEISDDEMKSLADELRDLLGIGEDEGDADIKFRDPSELSPAERQKVQAAGIRLAMGLIERGTTAFSDYAGKMVRMLGDKIRPWLKSFYEGARWTPGYEGYAFTPTEEVAKFDVQNFDKKQADPIKQAEMIVEERKANDVATQASKELTEIRNQNRKKEDEQITADTAALAGEAEAVAGEAENHASLAGGRQPERKTILRDLKRIDDTLDKVNDQLALLGYYEADEVEKDFNEAYGYMRNAEKKAVNNAVELTKQLVKDLGIDLKVTSSTTAKRGKKPTVVSANVAPAGGDVTVTIPLTEERELKIYITLEPADREEGEAHNRLYYRDDLFVNGIMYRVENPNGKGYDRYGSNQWLNPKATYAEMLRAIKRDVYKYLPVQTPQESVYKSGESVQYSADGGHSWTDAKVVEVDADGIKLDTGLAPVLYVNATAEQVRRKPAEQQMQELADMAERGESPYIVTPEVEAQLAEQRKEQENEDIFQKAERIAKETQEKKKKSVSSQKKSKVKPEQPIGDLFGGLFDEAIDNDKQGNSNRGSEAVADGKRSNSVGDDATGTNGGLQPKSADAPRENRSASSASAVGRKGTDGATHGTDEERGIQSRLGNRGRDESAADGGSDDTAVDGRGTTGNGIGAEQSAIAGAEGIPARESSPGTRGGSRPSSVKKPSLPKPEVKYTRNFRYGEDGNEADNYTAAQRLEGNVSAIETLAEILTSGKPATEEQKIIMSRFRGWGQVDLGKYYDVDYILRETYSNNPMNRLAKAIKLLDPSGEKGLYNAIKRASLSSYYTPTPIARAMNTFLPLAGYRGGNFLDPSMGNGVFEGNLPKEIQERSAITGVELDWLSGQLSRQLYPDANIIIGGFEKSELAPGSFDVVTSNVPFGDFGVADLSWKNDASPIKRSAQNRIHNYYAVKMLEEARPSGLVSMMTTAAVMDTRSNQNIRAHIADQGEIIGAIRLPDNTFKGTGVVTDIIFIRKWRDEQDRIETRNNPDYQKTEEAFLTLHSTTAPNKVDGSTQKVSHNAYYNLNRRNMLGTVQAGSQYSREGFGLTSEYSTEELASEIEKAIKRIVGKRKGELYNPTRSTREVHQAIREAYKGNGDWVSNGNLVIQDGKVGVLNTKTNEYGETTREFEELPKHSKLLPRITAMNEVRTAMKKLIAGQIEGLNDSSLAKLRKELQTAYDAFVGKYGRLQDSANAFILDDIDGYTLQALERWKSGKFEGLSDIFTKNTIKPALRLDGEKTPQEAITTSLAEYGYLRPDYLGKALGEGWIEKCGDFIFLTPNSVDNYVTRDEYLSADVVTKLKDAKEAAKSNPDFERNVKALEEVQPVRIPFDDIAIHLGARWIPVDVLNDFVKEIFGLRATARNRHYDPKVGGMVEEFKSGVRYLPDIDSFEINVEKKELGGQAQDWETPRKSAKEILQAALEDKTLMVFDTDKDGNKHLNEEQTELANQKISDLRDRFEEWLPSDPARVDMLEQAYNDRFNRIVIRKFDGSHLNVPGLMGKELRPHQKDAVWMLINNRGGIVDHIVGAGKTLVMQSAIMEMRRMGIAKKPMIVALKSTVAQIAREFKEAFPSARVLAPNDRDFQKANRKKFMANISLNDYDCVILSHEQYCMLDHTEEAERAVIDEQLWQLDNMIEYLYGSSDSSQLTKRQIKALEKRRENLRARLEKRLSGVVDREFCFENLGVDYLFVDECHQFKSLPYVTSYQKVAGLGSAEGSDRAVRLLTGIRHLQKMHQGDKGTVFLSGTTITNSLVEIYNLLNYLRPRELQRLGMPTFDAWASVFAVHSSELEAGTTGTFALKDRFRSFDNVPELSQLYAEIADVRNDTNLKLPKPAIEGNTIIVPESEAMSEINAEIINMLNNKDGSYFGITPKDPNRAPWGLHASTISAKAAVSPKLVFPDMEDEGGKVAAVCENVKKYYTEADEHRGVQLIFCEMGVPGKDKKYDAYTDIINRLVNDCGIPREQIAYIQEAPTEEKRKDLFQRVRDGKVRILIGGTKNMGTGVNVQDRITDMHMLTVPWTPSALEQCIGRGARQGNIVARDFMGNKVRVHYYATEGSLDLYKYQLLDAKGKMFTQFKMGTVNGGRSFDEGSADEDGNIDPAEMVAILSGNPVIFEKAKQEKLVKKLRALRNGFERDYQRKRAKRDELQHKIEAYERLVRLNNSDRREIERMGYRPDDKGAYPTTVIVRDGSAYTGGRTFGKPKEAGEYIHKLLKDGKNVWLCGYGVNARVVRVADEKGGLFTSHNEVQYGDGQRSILYRVNLSDDATAAGTAFRNLLNSIIRNGEVYARELESAKTTLSELNIGDGVFPKQKELDEAVVKLKELTAEFNKLGRSSEGNDGKSKFRLVEEGRMLDALNAEETETGFRYAQMVTDDVFPGVRPPMTGKVDGEWRAPMEFGEWEQSEEGLRKANGKADLVQGNGRTTGNVAYNPYFHIRVHPLNDQFSAAFNRPELIVVRGEYPKSELTSGYRADGAKNAVGMTDWHAGSVNGQLPEDKKVQTMLSRYFRPQEIVPWSEVADRIMSLIEGEDITFPVNVVPPMLRAELAKRGAKFQGWSGSVSEEDKPRIAEIERQLAEGNYYYDTEGSMTDADIAEHNASIRRKIASKRNTDPEAMAERVSELSSKFGVPVRIVASKSEAKNLPTVRKRNAKGWFDPETGEVVVVIPNNANVADVENTMAHEVIGHKGLRAFIGEENFDRFMGEIYNNASERIRSIIDRETQKLVDNETDRLREKKRKEHETNGEDAEAFYYTDMAEARVEAEEKREQFRRDATEEYMSDLGGRIGDEGFERMKQDELTLWGKIKKRVQRFLDRFLKGFKFAKSMNLTDKDLAYILYRTWDFMQGKSDVFRRAEDAARRNRAKYDAEDSVKFRDGGMSLEETITKMKTEAMQANTDNLQAKRDAMKAIGGNLNHLRQAMARQREYDITTVKSVTDLAKILMENGLLDDMSKYETQRILSAVKNVVGRQDVSDYVQKVMDIMVGNQLRNASNQLGRLLTIKGSKVDARGIEVQGELDPEGVIIAKVLKSAMNLPAESYDAQGEMTEDCIAYKIGEAQDRMGDPNQVIADNAALEYAGLQLAQQYANNIAKSKADEKRMHKSLKTAKEDKDAGRIDDTTYSQIVASTEEAIRQNKIDRAEAYYSLVEQVGDVMGQSIERAKAWREAEKQRVEEIHHNANSDMEGRELRGQRKDTRLERLNMSTVCRIFLEPLATFDQMLRMFGSKHANGEGYLWNRFMHGWTSAAEREQLAKEHNHRSMDNAAQHIFGKGKKWRYIYDLNRALPKSSIEIWDGGEKRTHELTQLDLLSIMLWDAQPTGRATLRHMGIDEAKMQEIENFLDARIREAGEWMVGYLAERYNDYNEVHKRMFGAPMTANDNYFPFLRAKDEIKRKEENGSDPDNDHSSTTTGAIKKRVFSVASFDIINGNAADLFVSHLQEMEHWAAFAELNRDLGTLQSYKRFKQQVKNMQSAYGSGAALWTRFKKVSAIATESYEPKVGNFDKLFVRATKGVAMGKVNLRLFTALKQILSLPAFAPDCDMVTMTKDLMAMGIPALKWAWNNLPLYRKRILSRTAGDYRLKESEYDTKLMKLFGKGMYPNIGVDAWTIAVGSHSVYKARLNRYLRYGMPEAEAEARAIRDAEICFNESQQSSEGPFLAPIQVDHTAESFAYSLFRNSAYSYTRKTHEAARNLRNLMSGKASVEFMAKQLHRQGIDADKAEKEAKRQWRKAYWKNAVQLVTFGWVLPWLWRLGGIAPLLLLSGDDEEKEKAKTDALRQSMFGPLEGITGGDVFTQGLNMAVGNEEPNWSYISKQSPMLSDIATMLQKLGKDDVSAINDILNILVGMGTGLNPQSVTDATVAVMDYCGDDAKGSRECALLIARLLNCPPSQLEKIYLEELGMSGEEASRMTPAEVAERYARYKMRREAPLTGWMRSKESSDSIRSKRIERVQKIAKEKFRDATDRRADETLPAWMQEYEVTKKRLSAIRKLREDDEDAYYDALDELEALPEYERYQIFNDYKRDIDDLTKQWLRAASIEERDSCVRAMVTLKAEMAEEMRKAQ